MGEFCVPADNAADIAYLVGGIGITPALAVARSYARDAGRFRMHIEYSVSHTRRGDLQ
jgi:ferredoxin-NADP reductase